MAGQPAKHLYDPRPGVDPPAHVLPALSSTTKVQWKCDKLTCDDPAYEDRKHRWLSWPSTIFGQGSRCPRCALRGAEREVHSWLETANARFKKEACKELLDGKRMDFLIAALSFHAPAFHHVKGCRQTTPATHPWL